jgi:hypothetical protein
MLYIVGQSIAVSVALISTLLLRKSILCRETKMFFQLFFISSVILFFADAIFFYKYHSDTWVWGDIADFMYFLFYSIIAYGHVILLATIRQDLKIREGKPEDLKNNLRVIVNKLMATM